MKSLLEQTEGLNDLIRQLEKLESQIRAGHFIDVYREVTRIIAYLKKNRRDLIETNQNVVK